MSRDMTVSDHKRDNSHPWQRGTCENINRLLRQYLHKSADLRIFSQEDLDRLADRLNDRPRRVLGWASPATVFGNAQPTPVMMTPA